MTSDAGAGRVAVRLGLTGFALACLLALWGGWDLAERAVRHVEVVGTEAGSPGSLPRLGDGESTALPGVPRAQVIVPDSAESLRAYFDQLGYRLLPIRAGAAAVPRIYPTRLPVDLAKVSETSVRKRLFLRSVLPAILRVNEEILAERRRAARIAAMLRAGGEAGEVDRNWLIALAARYRAEAFDIEAEEIERLLWRVDVIPPSLALAQAIQESGWGTSRFARDGNALYGQRAWGEDDPGLVPREGGNAPGFKVRAFPTLIDAVRSYVRNLNTHPSYAELRRLRAQMRAAGAIPDGRELARTLTRYSEEGSEYVGKLHGLIAANRLAAFDDARLDVRSIAREVVLDTSAEGMRVSYGGV